MAFVHINFTPAFRYSVHCPSQVRLGYILDLAQVLMRPAVALLTPLHVGKQLLNLLLPLLLQVPHPVLHHLDVADVDVLLLLHVCEGVLVLGYFFCDFLNLLLVIRLGLVDLFLQFLVFLFLLLLGYAFFSVRLLDLLKFAFELVEFAQRSGVELVELCDVALVLLFQLDDAGLFLGKFFNFGLQLLQQCLADQLPGLKGLEILEVG